jgi:hypothetical protein
MSAQEPRRASSIALNALLVVLWLVFLLGVGAVLLRLVS